MPKGIPKNGINMGRFKKTTIDVIKKCLMCNKDFVVPQFRDKKAKFCSSICYRKYPKKSTKIIISQCLLCKKQFQYFISDLGKRKYCSRSCRAKVISKFKPSEETKMKISLSHLGKKCPWNSERNKKYPLRGERSSNWQGGKSFEIYPMEWTNHLKNIIRSRDNNTCQYCFKKWCIGERKFNIHHIDYNKKNCSPENLITLCLSCHTKTGLNRKEWQKFFQRKYNITPAEGNLGPVTRAKLQELYK
jgi:hypothetical protein